MEEPAKIRETLEGFHGTEQYYPTTFGSMRVTDGVHCLREAAGAYWLIDVIESWNMSEAKVKNEEFQVWKFVCKDEKGLVTCEDGNDNEVARQEIDYTDFPLDEVTIWVSNGVLLLPNEY